jgi:hypothetical protein
VAREKKAKRLGISPSEINLSPAEAKEAKTAMRKKLSSGGQDRPAEARAPKVENIQLKSVPSKSPAPPASLEKVPKPKVPLPAPAFTRPDMIKRSGGVNSQKEEELLGNEDALSDPDMSGSVIKKKVGTQLQKTGSRATAKTKIDNLRRLTLKSLPTAVIDPVMLHLVAYGNHRNRLARQYQEYKNLYEDSGMLDPLRGLPPLSSLPRSILRAWIEATESLRESHDSPGTFILQTESGGSFWDKEKPSEACPKSLLVPLDTDLLETWANA